MLGLLETMRMAANDLRSIAQSHGFWMGWNILLALAPVVLGVILFRRSAHRTGFWWFGTVMFVLFLPNAPYVLTDVIHLFSDIRGARSDLQVLGEFIPLYLIFFTFGFGCYVVSLDRARAYFKHSLPGHPWWPTEAALHALCAIGIYLGRVVRLNSWQVFTRPQQVLRSFDWLVGLAPLGLIAATFVVLVIGTNIVRGLFWASATWTRQVRSTRTARA